MRKIALCLVALLAEWSVSHAGEIRVMPAPKDCPRKADIQGNRSLVYVNADQDCSRDATRPYGLIDERLGVQYHAPGFSSYIYLPRIIEPSKEDPADMGTLCVKLFPDGAVFEIIVPTGSACTLDWSHYSRRYWIGQACTYPGNYCVGIDTLKPEGQRRAMMSIRIAAEAAQVAHQ
jgi:hypothetical protein